MYLFISLFIHSFRMFVCMYACMYMYLFIYLLTVDLMQLVFFYGERFTRPGFLTSLLHLFLPKRQNIWRELTGDSPVVIHFLFGKIRWKGLRSPTAPTPPSLFADTRCKGKQEFQLFTVRVIIHICFIVVCSILNNSMKENCHESHFNHRTLSHQRDCVDRPR